MDNMVKLSILVMTTPKRRNNVCQRLLDALEYQCTSDVEILCLYDNKKRSIGEKRSNMVSMANGEYSCFIDDDDMITSDYISSLLEAIKSDADVLIFDVLTTGYTPKTLECKYSKDFETFTDCNTGVYRGKPAHIHAWKTSIMKQVPFIHINNGEDMDWVKKMLPLIKTEHQINKVLYYYQFDSNVSEVNK